MAVGVSGANACGGSGAGSGRREVRDAAVPAEGREGSEGAGPKRTVGGGVPEPATRRQA